MPAVRDGAYDAGLVIHEARFTYPSYGLTALVDLGEWWERDTGLPIPLGAILARRSLDTASLATVVRESVEYAWADPDASPSTSPVTPTRWRPTCSASTSSCTSTSSPATWARTVTPRPRHCWPARTPPDLTPSNLAPCR